MAYNSKYTGAQVEAQLDKVDGKQDIISDLATIRSGAALGATALQTETYKGTVTGIKMNGASKGTSGVVDLGTVITAHQDISGKADKSSLAAVATSGSYNDLSNKPTIPAAVTESTVSGWGFTKNTGTYSKPSTGIPKSDLASAVQTSLGKADTALQSYTEQYKGTITGVSANGTSVATSGVANIPAASTSAYGVTKLSSATNSTSTSLAATASAVKAAYDLANSYKGTVTGVKINGTTKSPSSGVVDLGTVITSHQDISGKQDKLVSGTNIKTINGESILGSGNISISGGSGGGEDIRYFTEFTVEDIIEASATNSTVMGSYSKLEIAAANNSLICIPYENTDTGYVIASYSYKEYSDGSFLRVRLEYNGTVYTLNDADDDLVMVEYPINLSGGIVELQIDHYLQIEIKDNTFYNLSVEGEFDALTVGIFDILHKGSTIRFFSSHWTAANGTPPSLEFFGAEVLWPNGVVPEIEMDTWYELSLTTSGDMSCCLAVLTPFKPAE